MPITFIDRRSALVAPRGITISGGTVYKDGAVVSKKASSPTSENIEGAKDFLISIGKPGAYSANDNDYQKQIGVYKDYHILIKHSPFTVFPKIKEPVRQTWKDENGDDVWLPQVVTNERYKKQLIPIQEVSFNSTTDKFTIKGNVAKQDLNVLGVIMNGSFVYVYDDENDIDLQVSFSYDSITDTTTVSYVHPASMIALVGTPFCNLWKTRTTQVPIDLHDAFDFEPTFVYFRKNPSNENEAKNNITSFVNAIKGRWLRIFDEYTGIGYDGVYLDSTDQDPKFKKRSYDHVEFSLHFRINGTLTTVPFKN